MDKLHYWTFPWNRDNEIWNFIKFFRDVGFMWSVSIWSPDSYPVELWCDNPWKGKLRLLGLAVCPNVSVFPISCRADFLFYVISEIKTQVVSQLDTEIHISLVAEILSCIVDVPVLGYTLSVQFLNNLVHETYVILTGLSFLSVSLVSCFLLLTLKGVTNWLHIWHDVMVFSHLLCYVWLFCKILKHH